MLAVISAISFDGFPVHNRNLSEMRKQGLHQLCSTELIIETSSFGLIWFG